MGMKARLTLSAVVGVAVIGTMSAHADRVAHDGGHGGATGPSPATGLTPHGTQQPAGRTTASEKP